MSKERESSVVVPRCFQDDLLAVSCFGFFPHSDCPQLLGAESGGSVSRGAIVCAIPPLSRQLLARVTSNTLYSLASRGL
jgi:hypothetical protein